MLSGFQNKTSVKIISTVLCTAFFMHTLPAAAYEKLLKPGWHLISIPEEPEARDPGTVLQSLEGSYDQVVAYESGDAADPWKEYDPASPGSSDLDTLDHRMGFWVHLTREDTLLVTGTMRASTAIPVHQGWNLVGYPLSEPRTVDDALESIAGIYDRVFTYESSDTASPWRGYAPLAPAYACDLAVMHPGKGYWVYALQDTDLVFQESEYPFVSIDVPEDGAHLTCPTQVIGTVDDAALETWTLEYRRKGRVEWVQIASGTEPKVEEVVGSIDPTTMLNGMYELRLTGANQSGYYTEKTMTVIVTGSMKVGNFTLSFLDLDIPVAGIPVQVIRSYDSRNKESRDFGTGWSLSIRDFQVEESATLGYHWQSYRDDSNAPYTSYHLRASRPHIISITASDGTVHSFEVDLEQKDFPLQPPQTVTLTFIPHAGTTSALEPQEPPNLYINGGFSNYWREVELVDIANLEIYDPDNYTLILKDGRELEIDQIKGLQELRDRNNNTLEITDNGIIHSSGKSVSFTRDSEDRITVITDPSGNTLNYTYDAAEDLVSVTDQEDYTTTFTYDANHYLTHITDPRGITPARQLYDDDGRMIAMVDAEGDTIHLSHDLDSRQEVVRDRLGNITVYEYDDRGNVTSKTDAKGNTWWYTYDELDNKTSETDPEGNTRTWTYDDQSNLLSETDPLGNTTIYTYNDQGQMLTKNEPDKGVTTYNYDANGNLISETDPLGHTIVRAYDGQGNLLSQSDSLGTLVEKEYDTQGNVTKETDAFGHETNFTYDDNGNQLTRTTTRTTASGTVTMTWGKTYDARGKVTSVTDPEGNTSYTEYNALGKKEAEVDKLGRRTEYVYDDRGNNTEKIFADGTTETYTFDANGNRTSSTDRSGRTTFYEYDPDIDRIDKITFPTGGFINTDTDETGSYVAVSDDKGNTTRYEYDEDGNLSATINALGDSTVYTYDGAGNQTSMTDARGNTTGYEYDLNGNKTRIIFPDGTTTTMAYDARGNKTSETDQAGNTIEFAYDALDRLITVTDALGNETAYTYDEVGNKLSQTDAKGNITTFEYDDLGRMIKRTLPLGISEYKSYDAEGNMISHTNFNGNTISCEYDENNKLIKKNFPDGTSETYTYSVSGQQETTTDNRGVTTYTYDDLGRLIKRVDPNSKSISYSYDKVGNRTSSIIGTDTTFYTYDVLNRSKTVKDFNGNITTYNYDSNGNRESILYPNGTIAEYTYDNLNRLTKLFNKKSNGDTISCYEYTLGPSGNRTKVTEHTGRTVDYMYDATYKLIQEKINDPDFGISTIEYTYDTAGNRITKIENGDTTTYSYDSNDRLLTENEITYTYDNNGNTLTKVSAAENITYSYDYQNRLIEVNDGTSNIEYAYDTDGLLIQKTVNGDVVNFLLDKNREFAQVLEEFDTNGNSIVKYIYSDDLISQKRSSLTSYYHYDGQMSTRQLTDDTGNVTDEYSYDAFGVLLTRVGATENNYLYTGEQYDPNIGFYYLRARFYNVSLGRFLTMDKWQGKVFEPYSLHKYLYCEGNPVGNWDPTGNVTLTEISATLSSRVCLSKIIMIRAILILPYVIFAELAEPILFHASRSRALALFAIAYTGKYTEGLHGLIFVNQRIIGRTMLILSVIMGAYWDIEKLIQDAITLNDYITVIDSVKKTCDLIEFAARHADDVVKSIYAAKGNY